MRKIVAVGATSAMAQATLRKAAACGDSMVLVGRSRERLDAVAADLRVRGAGSVHVLPVNPGDHASVESWMTDADTKLSGFDTLLVAHGVLTDQSAAEQDPAVMVRDLDVNFTSAAVVLTVAANRLEKRGGGSIAVISSVAGDRGRQSNYVYGAAKAALSTFTDGLRHRLHGKGVRVLTIKPGFVDTPMTAHLPKGPLFASAESVGGKIYRALGRQGVLYVPGFWRWILFIVRHLPEALFLKTRM